MFRTSNASIFSLPITTGCFAGNEIIFLLISQPVKHLNCYFMSYKITESIAFWYQVSKNFNTQSVILSIQKLWWYSSVKMHENTLKVYYQQKLQYHFANTMTPKNLLKIVQWSNCNCGYYILSTEPFLRYFGGWDIYKMIMKFWHNIHFL